LSQILDTKFSFEKWRFALKKLLKFWFPTTLQSLALFDALVMVILMVIQLTMLFYILLLNFWLFAKAGTF